MTAQNHLQPSFANVVINCKKFLNLPCSICLYCQIELMYVLVCCSCLVGQAQWKSIQPIVNSRFEQPAQEKSANKDSKQNMQISPSSTWKDDFPRTYRLSCWSSVFQGKKNYHGCNLLTKCENCMDHVY